MTIIAIIKTDILTEIRGTLIESFYIVAIQYKLTLLFITVKLYGLLLTYHYFIVLL